MRIKEKLKDVKNFLEQNCEIVERKGYGFEADKPISVPTIQDMYDVLKNLKIILTFDYSIWKNQRLLFYKIKRDIQID